MQQIEAAVTSSRQEAPHYDPPDTSEEDPGALMSQEDFWTAQARDLHDGVIQEMWYLQTELSSLATRVPDNQREFQTDVNRLQKIAQDAYQELRATLSLLRSKETRTMDLKAELAQVTMKFTETLGMEVDFHSSHRAQKVELEGEVVRHICRLIQEALWNSWRHSMSSRAKVTMQRSKIGLAVTVSDDGCGFHPDQVDETHYGIRNMRERAESIHGRLYVASRAAGTGTLVTLHVPLDTP